MDDVPQPGSLEAEAGVFCSTFDQTGTRLITGGADKTIKVGVFSFLCWLLCWCHSADPSVPFRSTQSSPNSLALYFMPDLPPGLFSHIDVCFTASLPEMSLPIL